MAGLLSSVVFALAVLGGLQAQDAPALPQVITLPGGQTFVLPAPAANNLDLVNNNNVYNNVSAPDATPVVVDNVIQPVAPVVVERQNPTVVVTPTPAPTVVIAPTASPGVVIAPTAAPVPQQVGWTWGVMPLGGLLGARTLGMGFGGLGGLGLGGFGLGGLGLGGMVIG